jgi:hypothetical protein
VLNWTSSSSGAGAREQIAGSGPTSASP